MIRLKEAREDAFYIPGSREKAGEENWELKSAEKAGRNGVAVDIGTTTVAMELADLETGEKPRIYTSLNTQRQYGITTASWNGICSRMRVIAGCRPASGMSCGKDWPA